MTLGSLLSKPTLSLSRSMTMVGDERPSWVGRPLQGYVAHKKSPPPGTLQQAYAKGPMVILGGWAFLMGEVPLHGCDVLG